MKFIQTTSTADYDEKQNIVFGHMYKWLMVNKPELLKELLTEAKINYIEYVPNIIHQSEEEVNHG